jgi:peptidoglycan/LPS O-acetylase OafA/YrhL
VKAGFQIPSLDGLRALSIGIVFLAHAGLHEIIPGAFGVTVFFFLSGYLITTLLRLEQQESGRISLKKFYLRRALRILPPFYTVLTGAVVASLVHLTPGVLDVRAVAAQALHYANYWIVLHGFDGLPAGTGVYWSLAVEEHFYLLFPWLFVGLLRWNPRPERRARALFVLCALFLAWRTFVVLTYHPEPDRTGVASDTRFDSLLFGCALAIGENPALDRSAIGERVWKYVLLPIALMGLAGTFLYRSEFFRETVRYTIQGICLVPVFVCAVRYPTWLPIRPLNFRPLAYLGALSYSLYLIHQVVLSAFEHRAPLLHPVPRGMLAFAIAFALSWTMYQLVEKPCAKLRRKLHA